MHGVGGRQRLCASDNLNFLIGPRARQRRDGQRLGAWAVTMNSAARRKAKKKEDGVRRGSLTGHNGQTLFFSPSPRLPDIGHKALCPISYVDIRHACDTWVDVDSIRVLYLAPRYDTIRYDSIRYVSWRIRTFTGSTLPSPMRSNDEFVSICQSFAARWFTIN